MLAKIRRLNGLSQKELAAKADVDQHYLTKLETGEVKTSGYFKDIASVLRINPSVLTSAVDVYPFAADFYTLFLVDPKIRSDYKLISSLICEESDFIDVVFLVGSPLLFKRVFNIDVSEYPVLYIALRNDRDAVFLIRRRAKKRVKKVPLSAFESVALFQTDLHSLPRTVVYEQTKEISTELYDKIDKQTVTRADIVRLFPDDEHFRRLLEAHENVKEKAKEKANAAGG